jgi:hypothetical protein
MAEKFTGAGSGVSRRSVLRKAGITIGGATILAGSLAAQPARAEKVSQAAAGYQPTPNGDKSCANCSVFQPPSSCQVVDGTIAPTGYCKLWTAKS